MACHISRSVNNCIPVSLGFIDEEIQENNSSFLSYKTSKIGGVPDWCLPGCQPPVCPGCHTAQCLVVQVYAPVMESTDHRTLYIFACLTPTCWGSTHSWCCLRVQKPATPPPQSSGKATKSTATIQASKDLFTAPAWDSDSDDSDNAQMDPDGNNANISFFVSGNNNSSGDNSNNSINNMDDCSQLNIPTTSTENLSREKYQRSLNLNIQNANKETDVNATAAAMDMINLNKNQNLAGAVGQASFDDADDAMEEATAFIEGSEGDSVTIDSPELPTTNIAQWFKPITKLPEGWRRPNYLRPYYLSVEEEQSPGSGKPVSLSAHERDLLQQYSAHQESRPADDGTDGGYIKSVPVHGDVFIHKFRKRIAQAPQQVIRYCRDTGCSPLVLRPITDMSPARCSHCRAPLSFELQVMPQLIDHLIAVYATNGNIQSPIAQNTNSAPKKPVDSPLPKLKTGAKPAVNVDAINENCRMLGDGEGCKAASKASDDHMIQHTYTSLGSPSVQQRSTRNRNQQDVSCSPKTKRKSHEIKDVGNLNKLSKTVSKNARRDLQSEFASSGVALLSGVLEFGTVLVYTCSASCWAGKPVFETVLVQAEQF